MILLVDEQDREMGYGEKQEVHQKGILHRAFSIFVFNSKKELLLQKRERSKYHSPGLWTNTCCSHQRINEELKSSVHRRLKEEMGFDTELKEVLSFSYRAEFDNGLIENEFDHVFVGYYEGEVIPEPTEVEDYSWMDLKILQEDIAKNPESYTYWMRVVFPSIYELYIKGEI